MNTRDGISETDMTAPLIGSHDHYNWGFTSNGIYRITFEASGNITGSTNVTTPLTTFIFHVLPLPTSTPQIQLENPHLTGTDGFAFELSGAEGLWVEIQVSDDFRQWASMTNLTATTSLETVTIPLDPAKAHRFFRVQKN